MKKDRFNRRDFIKTGAAGVAGAHLFSSCAQHKTSLNPPCDELRVKKYNDLGATGLKVSDVSLGGAREDSVLRYALDKGINLYDTAEQYFNGQHEADYGRAFKDVRDKVIVVTKHVHGMTRKISKKDVIDRFDASLKRMGWEYIDIAMIHHLDDPKTLENQELLSGYEALKKAGKFRFFGFSTHKAEPVCEAAFDTGLFSVMLLIYNSMQYPNRSKIITKAKKLGVGVLAMKTMMGRRQDRIVELINEKTSFSQAAIKWALTDEAISSVCISMRTFEHVDEYLKASGKTLTPDDEAVLQKYIAAVDNKVCRVGCDLCLSSCPSNVAIHDIMRFGMYYKNYGDEKKALQEYANLDHKASDCKQCEGRCSRACPHGLQIQDRMIRYDEMLRI